jgi:hypothetical protein
MINIAGTIIENDLPIVLYALALIDVRPMDCKEEVNP